MTRESTEVSIHRIDSRDCITFVNEAWLTFAEVNDAPDLTRDRVLGKPLQQFLQGDVVLDLWRILIGRIRQRGQPMLLPFRCDSPDQRRFMEMTLSPISRDEVEFACRLLRSEQREPVVVLDRTLKRSDQWLTMCAWCNRFLMGDSLWLEVEDVVRRMGLLDQIVIPKLTGGVCPHCYDRITDSSK